MSRTDEGTFAGVGGVSIRWKRWEPVAAPRGVIVISHGYAEHVGRYEHVADHWTARGFAVAALDHRGHGRSDGPRGHCNDFREFTSDLRTLVDRTVGWWPNVPRGLFGHSMGGLIAFLYLLEHGDTVRAGALSGPAFRVPAKQSRQMRLGALLAWLPFFGSRPLGSGAVDPSTLSRDPKVGEAYMADPLVHQKASPRFVRAFLRGQKRAYAEAGRLGVPLLVLQGDADRLVDPQGARAMDEHLRAEHEVVMLPGYYHELLNEPPAERDAVFARLDPWWDRFVR